MMGSMLMGEVRLCRRTAFTLVIFLGFYTGSSLASWTAESYWNDRYGTKPGWESYTSDDRSNGMFSDLPNLQSEYQLASSQYKKTCGGCSCSKTDPIVTACSSNTVNLVKQDFINITAETFTSSGISSITILDCGDFNLIGNNTFDHLTSLKSMTIQETGIEGFPDVALTSLETLNLIKNKIAINTETLENQVLPSSLTHVALTYNEFYWLPAGMFSGTNIRILSLAYNMFERIPYEALSNMAELLYLGLEGNLLKIITYDNLKALANSKLQHLNVSNNELYFIERQAFSLLTNLKILELHQNNFANILYETIYNIPELLHLDLNNNNLEVVASKAFVDLPKLVTLRLHSQKTPMTAISFDSFKNINQSLEHLWVSSNALKTLPHQVLAESSYSALLTLRADNNQIHDVVEFGSEAYDVLMQPYYALKKTEYVAFSTTPNLQLLDLSANAISELQDTDFCQASHLQELYLYSNQLTEDKIAINTFDCIPEMRVLSLSSNQIQYVPEAVTNSSHLPDIRELHLSDNHITFLEKHFANLSTLQNLQLNGNNIVSVENGTFPDNIQKIHMSGNDFRFLHEGPFTGLVNLNELNLGNNEITVIPDTALQGCTSLNSVNLNGNKIGRLMKVHFQDCPLGGKIQFQKNEITYIESGTFAHVTSCDSLYLNDNKLPALPDGGGDFTDLSIQNLYLHNNRITSLKTGIFNNLAVDKNLQLDGNKIARVESLAFTNVTIGETFSLGNNPIKSIQSGAFSSCQMKIMDMQNINLTELQTKAFTDHWSETLNLQGNPLGTIQPETFCGVTISKFLYLQNCDLTALGGPMFCASSTVDDLSLNDNQLFVMPSDVFQGAVINKLNLEDNELIVFPGPSLANQNLEEILLARNLIFEFPVGSLVSAQTAAKKLDVSNNKLTVLLSGLLDPLVNLKILRLSNNEISWMDADALNSLTKLQEIYLQNNQLPYFPALPLLNNLETLDLSNNAIETLGYNAFLAFDTDVLTSIDLDGNPLECDCYLYEVANFTKKSLKGGECSNPSRTTNYLFAYSKKNKANYFLNNPVEDFQCSAADVTVSDPGPYQLQVDFAAPSSLYPMDSQGGNGSVNSSGWNFSVACEDSNAVSLTRIIPGSSSQSDFSVTFVKADGVIPGTRYGCMVTLETGGYASGHSPTAYITTQTIAGGSINDTGECGVTAMCLPMTMYDFSFENPDFNGRSSAVFSQPTYIGSPYGAWLTVTNSPATDDFAQFFREVTGVNHVYMRNVTLGIVGGVPETTFRFWEPDFYPVDGMGYMHQAQKDCISQLHNFGYTTAVRAGMLYEGSGTIALGGGDEIWLFLNGVLMLEVITNPADSTVPCKRIDITNAKQTGGALLTPYSGIVSAGGECVASTALLNEQVQLSLEIGDTYHFDVFQIERFGCKSKYFLEVTDISFAQFLHDDPAMDYFITMPENTAVDSIVSVLDLTDTFSMGPSFAMSIEEGNEARHFELKQDTTSNRNAAVAAPAPVFSYTSLPGVAIPFVECSSPPVLIPEPDIAGSESFTSNAGSALLTLKTDLDYEVAKRYVIVLTVTDTGTSPDRTGQMVLRVKVSDVNDNCPILEQSSFTLHPVPALQVDPILYLNASDVDSGVNAEIMYAAAWPSVSPSLDRYDTSYDLYDMVYNETSIVIVTLVAIDKGNPPHGVTATASITLSNSCLLSVLFEAIDVKIHADVNTGNVTLRIPKYWVYDYECLRTAGMQKGYIQDWQVTASSHVDLGYPGRARLNETYDPTGFLLGGWVASVTDNQQWLQVDMLVPYKFQQLITQGREDEPMWVTKFRIQYSDDESSWTVYTDKDGTFRFRGNDDQHTEVTRVLDPPILARYIRINPRQWEAGVSMRIELIGCEQAEQFYYDTACERCQTSWFCIGDGQRTPCGRCDPPVDGDTCGRSPSEHSFGASDECTTCPLGWICHDGYASPCPKYHYASCNETYCPDACTQCEVGHACRGGMRYECTPGQKSDGYREFCDTCLPGTYQSESGQSECTNCDRGYFSSTMKSQCSPCPADTWSSNDGTSCQGCGKGECRCLEEPYPCYNKNVECFNLAPDGISYVCGECPSGYQGDGSTCTDIDECSDMPSLCWGGRCVNTKPGYQCLACPWGYTGSYEDGLSHDIINRVYELKNEQYATQQVQVCKDIDECSDKHGGCDPNSQCINTVVIPPQAVVTPAQQTKAVGQSVEFRCQAQGTPPFRVQWSREGDALPDQHQIRNGILLIYNLQPEDEGRYICTVSSDSGVVREYAFLRVSSSGGGPGGGVQERVQVVPLGSGVQLECEVSGTPRPVIAWERVGGSLPRQAQIRGDDILFIPDVRPEDMGTYRCVATNQLGTVYSQVILEIQTSPVFRVERQSRSASVGSKVILTCQADGSPQPTVTWSKQGGFLPRDHVVQGGVLTIPSLRPEDFGEYVCTATNQFGTAQSFVTLESGVLVPQFLQNPASYISYDTLRDAYLESDVEVSFRPEVTDGLMVYNGQLSTGGGDFIAMGMRDGRVEYRFDMGSGPAIIRSNQVELGKWHTVRFRRDRSNGVLIVDGMEYRGEAQGSFQGLDLTEDMYVGGVPDYTTIARNSGFQQGFVGGISRVEISGVPINIGGDALDLVGIIDFPVCQDRPCRNGGQCRAASVNVGYQCFCPKGYSGMNCELVGERCFPGACGDGGRCYDLPNNLGYRCACPVGKTGDRCERGIAISDPAFNHTSYIAYPTIQDALQEVQILMTFKPQTLDDAILLYNAQSDDGNGDFISLAIKDEKVEFRYDSGSGPAVIRSQEDLVLNEWTTLVAERNQQDGSLSINGGVAVKGVSPGSTIGLNLRGPLYIGGVDPEVRVAPGAQVNRGFKGCVTEVLIKGTAIDLVNDALASANILNCGDKSICASRPCQNGGTCENIGGEYYICSCPPEYAGRNCEQEVNICLTNNPCQNRAECLVVDGNYQCKCPVGFTGRTCSLPSSVRTSARFYNGGYLELPGRLFPHRSGQAEETVTLTVQTDQSDGLLFWHGQESDVSGRGNDFFSVGLQRGHVVFSYELGSGAANITTLERINDGRPHEIIVTRTGKSGSLELDGFSYVVGESGGILTELNTRGNIFIGGTPNVELMSGGTFRSGLLGCISDLYLNSAGPLDFGEEAVGGANVGPC